MDSDLLDNFFERIHLNFFFGLLKIRLNANQGVVKLGHTLAAKLGQIPNWELEARDRVIQGLADLSGFRSGRSNVAPQQLK